MTAGSVAIIVIGRNEGERLRRCLDSCFAATARVVYVDSGSKDGSVALARRMGVEVVELDPTSLTSTGYMVGILNQFFQQ